MKSRRRKGGVPLDHPWRNWDAVFLRSKERVPNWTKERVPNWTRDHLASPPDNIVEEEVLEGEAEIQQQFDRHGYIKMNPED